MKLSVEARGLSQGLAAVGKAISLRPTHPVLSCVLFKAYGSQIKLTGFDLSLGIETTLMADVVEPGDVAIPFKLFSDIVGKVDGVLMIEVTVNEYGSRLATIKYDGGKIELLCLDAGEYPELPSLTVEPLPISSEALKLGIKSTAFAASTDETKQILTGVHIKGKDKEIEFAATDGHRLAKVTIPIEGSLGFEITLPSRALKELDKLLGEDSVSLMADSSQAVFKSENTKLTCRVLGGTYPAYNQLLPDSFTRQAIFERKRLITALDRVGVFANEKNNVLGIEFNDHEMVVSSSSQDVGHGQDVMTADVVGGAISVGFNIAYLRSGLATMDCSEVKVGVNEANQPVVFNPIDGADFRYLVMPVKLT